jgi:hypothetical protein
VFLARISDEFHIVLLLFAWYLRIMRRNRDGAAIGRDDIAFDIDFDGFRFWRDGIALLRREGIRGGGLVDRRHDFQLVRVRLAALHGQAKELCVFAAMGEEENAAAIGHPFSVVLALLVRRQRVGELARAVLLSIDEPDVGLPPSAVASVT